jgi:hypothetical protein
MRLCAQRCCGYGCLYPRDRATWLSFMNLRELKLLVKGDQRTFNQDGIILVNPAKHPHVKAAAGRAFIDWDHVRLGALREAMKRPPDRAGTTRKCLDCTTTWMKKRASADGVDHASPSSRSTTRAT